MMTIAFDHSITQKFNEAIRREWLETNGLGGWASSTISGAHTRRYHGLLVAAAHPPVGRMVMLSKLDETVAVDGQRLELSTNVYSDAIHPQGYRYFQHFSKSFFPVFTYEAAGVRLHKTIAAVNGENTTLILYEVSGASRDFTLELQPFMAGRDYHSLTHANDQMTENFEFENDHCRLSLVYRLGSGHDDRPSWANVSHRPFRRCQIHVDDDGLLYAGEPGVQLTWMDAKIGDWVVTPRTGKAVEINGLWYNALAIMAFLYNLVGHQTPAQRYGERAEKTKDSFRLEFWYEEGGYLYDYVDGEKRDTSIRPNQIFALSLPFPLIFITTSLHLKRYLEIYLIENNRKI